MKTKITFMFYKDAEGIELGCLALLRVLAIHRTTIHQILPVPG